MKITIITAPPRSAAQDAGPERSDSPGPGSQREVLRTQLIAVLLDKLAHQRQLLILSPRHGGARTLVRQMVARSDFAPDAITRLSPSALARTAADYFAALTGDPGVQTALGYDAWQRRRLRPGGERHLIVLSHDGGEGALLGELAEVLRGCQQDPRVHILVAGEARAAALKYGLGMRPRGLRDASSRFGDASSRFGNASSRFGWASSRLGMASSRFVRPSSRLVTQREKLYNSYCVVRLSFVPPQLMKNER